MMMRKIAWSLGAAAVLFGIPLATAPMAGAADQCWEGDCAAGPFPSHTVCGAAEKAKAQQGFVITARCADSHQQWFFRFRAK